MAILNRTTLRQKFINGVVPTGQDFSDLIDSALNRWDDQFFGNWEPGRKYRNGDVVVYDKALYKLEVREPVDDCEDTNGSGASPISEDDSYCSTTPPPSDDNWCKLELKDPDWEFEEKDDVVEKVYQRTANVGIGTDDPAAKLDVAAPGVGHILLNPADEDGSPVVTLVKLDEGQNINDGPENLQTMSLRIDGVSQFQTNNQGFAFLQVSPPTPGVMTAAAPPAGKEQAAAPPPATPEPLFLSGISSDENRNPVMGIGAEAPEGTLHAEQKGRGKWIVHPYQNGDAAHLLANLRPKGNYLLTGLSDEQVYFSSDSEKGFRFLKGPDITELEDAKALPKPLASITHVHEEGRLGIGTENPKSRLEAASASSGSIRLHLGGSNPVVSILNTNPTVPTYLTVGVDQLYGALISNAPNGFVFKAGEPPANDNQVNITTQGSRVAFINKEGKLGIRTTESPTDYDADVNGQVRALSLFLETDSAKIDESCALVTKPADDNPGDNPYKYERTEFISRFKKLRAMAFQWKNGSNAKETEDTIGFIAEDAFEAFPELIKISKSNYAFAYANLTAVLVEMVQIQQEQINALKDAMTDLAKEIHTRGRKGDKQHGEED